MFKKLAVVVGMVLLFSQMALGVNLVHWHNQLGRTKVVTDLDLAKEFMALNPEVVIEVEEYPSSSLKDLILVAIASNSTPTSSK